MRVLCDMSPCSAPTEYPWRLSICSTREASFLYNANIRMRASEAPVVLVFLCDSDFRTVSRRWLETEVRIVIDEINGSNYSFDRASSKTSTHCSTLLFAVKSSLPTVTLTGSRWNVLAKRRTASGQVALTIICLSEHSNLNVNKTHTS